jgi:hypothetical protein
MFFKASLAAVALCFFATTAQAQDNPVSGFLKSLGSIGQKGSTKSQDKPVDNALVEILKTYAQADSSARNAYDACTSLARGTGLKQTDADFKLGNYVAANAGYRLHAEYYAKCAVDPSEDLGVARIPVSKAVDMVGANLAMSVIAASLVGLETPQSAIDARNALTLLNANPEANKDFIQKVRETGLAGRAPAAPGGKPVAMTAKAAISDFKANTFAFESKYAGKTLTISGPIQSISGSDGRATITIFGFKAADPNNQSLNDEVRCMVSDSAALPSVMKLKTGAKATVSGLFQPSTQVLHYGIELQNCRVN